MEVDVEGLDFYLDAFRELGSCRSGGFDLMPIPFTAISEYSTIYQIGDFEDFAYVIRRMDDAYLEAQSKRQPQKGKGGK